MTLVVGVALTTAVESHGLQSPHSIPKIMKNNKLDKALKAYVNEGHPHYEVIAQSWDCLVQAIEHRAEPGEYALYHERFGSFVLQSIGRRFADFAREGGRLPADVLRALRHQGPQPR